MRKTFYLKHKATFDHFNGLLLQNPVLERGLVLAPVVVASYNYKNSFILGFSFMVITFFTVLLSSFVPHKIPFTLRTIIYTLIACIVFIPTAIYMQYIDPQTVVRLGVFLPLLVANSLIVVKSESRFHKSTKGYMILDLLCHTVGFFIVIVFVGVVRELIGNGSFAGDPIAALSNFPKSQAMLLPFSGFIILGFLAAAVKKLKYRLENPKDRKADDDFDDSDVGKVASQSKLAK